MLKTIIYYEDGERKERSFPVKAYRTKREIVVKSEPWAEIRAFIQKVDYKGSYYH